MYERENEEGEKDTGDITCVSNRIAKSLVRSRVSIVLAMGFLRGFSYYEKAHRNVVCC